MFMMMMMMTSCERRFSSCPLLNPRIPAIAFCGLIWMGHHEALMEMVWHTECHHSQPRIHCKGHQRKVEVTGTPSDGETRLFRSQCSVTTLPRFVPQSFRCMFDFQSSAVQSQSDAAPRPAPPAKISCVVIRITKQTISFSKYMANIFFFTATVQLL